MTYIDGKKLEELRTHFRDKAEHEIYMSKHKDGVDLKEDDITAIYSKYAFEAEQRIKKIVKLGPKQLSRMELLFDSHGWRAGYTKQTVEARAKKRRKNKKMAHKSKRVNNKK